MTGRSSITTIPFVKASACGNDFLLMDGALAPPDMAGFTRRICDRHEGVGADGVEWMFTDASADVEIRLLNADGSEAEISGNGTRCIAAYLCEEQGREKITIRTGAGVKTCTLTARRDQEYEFEMEMGEVRVEREITIKLGAREVRGISVSIGNPHFVMFVTEFGEKWQFEAAEIQHSAEFKQGVNVEVVVAARVHDLQARFFERGVGETRSSGTGSCAAAMAAIASGKAESPVRVRAPGGAQMVRTEGQGVFLRGPARMVCRGEFFL